MFLVFSILFFLLCLFSHQLFLPCSDLSNAACWSCNIMGIHEAFSVCFDS